MMKYWLLKTEPTVFSFDDLLACPLRTEPWTGVRNYQARNFIRDGICKGDRAFFYHSSCAEPGIVGVVEIVSDPYPDPSAFDPQSPYFDPKSQHEKPTWYVVDVLAQQRFEGVITLEALRACPELQEMVVLRRGNRLSVTPVTFEAWDFIVTRMAKIQEFPLSRAGTPSQPPPIA